MSFCAIRTAALSLFRQQISKTHLQAARYLNLQEYQAKKLLDQNGIQVQEFKVIEKGGSMDLRDFDVDEYVVKAQILAGGRGKGHFDNGFQGGVKVTKDPSEALSYVQKMMGHRLITKQTPKAGILVEKVMVAHSVNITRETYLCILMDRESNGPVIMASPDGGMDIETVAAETPERILTIPIDPEKGVSVETALKVADFLKFKGPLREQAADQVRRLYEFFDKIDAIQLEINPLAETDKGKVIAVDCKLNFDENAKFRQQEIYQMEDHSESDPKEVEATKYNLNYIAMDGNIGCMVNGAGLAMATCDIIKLNGGAPANFLDVGGGVREEQVLKAFQIITSDPSVKAILVNIFGGIVNCAIIANGIVNAAKTMGLRVPLIVRLEGNNVNEAKKILTQSGLNIQQATNLEDAAKQAVAAV